jgi:ABC-2 type transport system ATP-binding protein
MLELRGITKKFSAITVVDDVSFSVAPGEVLGYLGPNGAGKSTTIKMLAGLLQPSRGKILYKGRDIRDDLCGYKALTGYVPEQSDVYPHLSGYDYLVMVGRLRGIPDKTLGARVPKLLEILGLDQDMDGPLASYSKGMKQKVLLAASLIHDPAVLLLDEPLSGLDVTTGLIVRDLIRMLAADGKVIIYSSHVLEVTEKVCSKVIILHRGKIVANDSVEHLRTLMHLPSLADIFSQLVVHEDTGLAAAKLVGAVKGEA